MSIPPSNAPSLVVLDTNVVLDMLILDDPHIPPIRELVAQGTVRWIADQAQLVFETSLKTARGRGLFRGELRRVFTQQRRPRPPDSARSAARGDCRTGSASHRHSARFC